MGNIGHRRINSLYPSSNNLDNPSTKSGDNIHDNSTEQFNSSFDPKKQSILQLNLSNNAQIQQVWSNISLYQKHSQNSLNGGYASISSLKEYYKVDKQGYCTKQQTFYLIFQGCSCCGLKDQFGIRKMLAKKFTDSQIIYILKTYLIGVYIYIKQFKRNIEKIDFDDIGFQIFNPPNGMNQNQMSIPGNSQLSKRKIRIFFMEPWLKEKKEQQNVSVNQVNILLQNPSPQRLKQNSTSFPEYLLEMQNKKQNEFEKHKIYDKQLFSLFFSTGVIGLKLLEMGFVDDIYMRSPNKRINLQRIEGYLEKFQMGNNRNQNNNLNKHMDYEYSVSRKKLIGGLKILLLSNSPQERQKIFQFWSIKLDQINYLQEINLQYSDHFQNGRDEPKFVQRVQKSFIHRNTHLPVQNQQKSNNQTKTNLQKKLYEPQNQVLNGNKKENQVINNKYFIPNTTLQNNINLSDRNFNQNLSKKQNLPNRNYVYKLDHVKTVQNFNERNNQVVESQNNPTYVIGRSNNFYSPNYNHITRIQNFTQNQNTSINKNQGIIQKNSLKIENGFRMNGVNQTTPVHFQPVNYSRPVSTIQKHQTSINRSTVNRSYQPHVSSGSNQNSTIIYMKP